MSTRSWASRCISATWWVGEEEELEGGSGLAQIMTGRVLLLYQGALDRRWRTGEKKCWEDPSPAAQGGGGAAVDK